MMFIHLTTGVIATAFGTAFAAAGAVAAAGDDATGAPAPGLRSVATLAPGPARAEHRLRAAVGVGAEVAADAGQVTTYVMSEVGAESCPAGSTHLTSEECEAFAETLDGYVFDRVDSWTNHPPGCFCRRNGDNWDKCYYNTNQDGPYLTHYFFRYFLACAPAPPDICDVCEEFTQAGCVSYMKGGPCGSLPFPQEICEPMGHHWCPGADDGDEDNDNDNEIDNDNDNTPPTPPTPEFPPGVQGQCRSDENLPYNSIWTPLSNVVSADVDYMDDQAVQACGSWCRAFEGVGFVAFQMNPNSCLCLYDQGTLPADTPENGVRSNHGNGVGPVTQVDADLDLIICYAASLAPGVSAAEAEVDEEAEAVPGLHVEVGGVPHLRPARAGGEAAEELLGASDAAAGERL